MISGMHDGDQLLALGGVEQVIVSDRAIGPYYDDAEPLADSPLVGAYSAGCEADNGTGSGRCGSAMTVSGGFRRAFVAENNSISGTNTGGGNQAICAFCIPETASGTAGGPFAGLWDETSNASHYVIYAQKGNAAMTTTFVVDVNGNVNAALQIQGNHFQAAGAYSSTGTGGEAFLAGPSGGPLKVTIDQAGDANLQGNLTVVGPATLGAVAAGNISGVALTLSGAAFMTGLPTSNPHALGELWNNAGVMNVSGG
jgi:hypothetical protein